MPLHTRLRAVVNTLTLATPLGLALARYGRAQLVPGPDGLILACGYRAWFPAPRARAVTVGDVVLLRMSRDDALPATVGTSAPTALRRRGLLAHESVHARQWACWAGPVGFLPAYAAASLWSLLTVGNAATGNVFEVRAGLEDGGYSTLAPAVSRRSRRRGRRSPSS